MNSLYASRNQLANLHNPYQGDTPRALFICSAGLLRSATAAHIFSAPPYDWNTRTAGIDTAFALNPVTEALLCWADHIFVMDDIQWQMIRLLFSESEHLNEIMLRVQVLHIPDKYSYRHPELIDLLKEHVHLLPRAGE
jgi:predicted protein tyrosine phosphatase